MGDFTEFEMNYRLLGRRAAERLIALIEDEGAPAPLQARPWPRAALAAPSGRSYTAGFADPAATSSFYPFEPRLSHPATDDGHARPVPAHEDRQP